MVTSRDRPLMSQWNDKRSIPWGVNRNRDFAWTVLNRFFFTLASSKNAECGNMPKLSFDFCIIVYIFSALWPHLTVNSLMALGLLFFQRLCSLWLKGCSSSLFSGFESILSELVPWKSGTSFPQNYILLILFSEIVLLESLYGLRCIFLLSDFWDAFIGVCLRNGLRVLVGVDFFFEGDLGMVAFLSMVILEGVCFKDFVNGECH